MNQKFVDGSETRRGERGGARLKFIIVLAIFAVIAYAGYLYIPVRFDAYRYKDLMQHDVDMAATQGYPLSWVTDQLKKGAADNNVPSNAIITPNQQNGQVFVRVQFTRPIEFPGYTYQYDFDETAKSTTFLTIK
jgi:hypothetical protein